MISIIERDETFGMLGCFVYFLSVLDAHGLIERRMEDEKRFFQRTDVFCRLLILNVFQKLLLDLELTTSEKNRASPITPMVVGRRRVQWFR